MAIDHFMFTSEIRVIVDW